MSDATEAAAPIVILLADDHPVVRAGLRAVLQTEPDFSVYAEAATAEEAVDRAAGGGVDVVLMDLQFGGGIDGIEATRRITRQPGPPRVLVLTTYDTDADILAAVEAGATGYLLKDTPPSELAAAVRRAASGRSALTPSVADRLLGQLRRPDGTRLTAREAEVLQLVADGLANAQISKQPSSAKPRSRPIWSTSTPSSASTRARRRWPPRSTSGCCVDTDRTPPCTLVRH